MAAFWLFALFWQRLQHGEILMQPMNYTIDMSGGLNGLNAVAQGAQFGANIAQARQQIDMNNLKMQQAREQARQDEYKRQRFYEVAQDPTAKKVMQLMVEHPELSEQFKRSFDVLNENEKKDAIETSFSAVYSIKNGDTKSAVDLIDRKIEAAKNSGDQVNLQRFEMLKNAVVSNPQAALVPLQALLASNMGADKWAEMEAKLDANERENELQPAKLKKAEADADAAATKAKFAEDQEVAELAKKNWDINKLKNDISISRANLKIATESAKYERAKNDAQREEALAKIGEAKAVRAQKVREIADEVATSRSTIDDLINTIDQIEQHPSLDRVVGAVEGRFNTAPLSDGTADVIALIESFSSKAFISQREKLKGGGAITDFEGVKAADALANLSRVQSEEQFKKILADAKRRLLKGRQQLADKYGVPDSIPDTPEAKPAKGWSLDDIVHDLGVR